MKMKKKMKMKRVSNTLSFYKLNSNLYRNIKNLEYFHMLIINLNYKISLIQIIISTNNLITIILKCKYSLVVCLIYLIDIFY